MGIRTAPIHPEDRRTKRRAEPTAIIPWARLDRFDPLMLTPPLLGLATTAATAGVIPGWLARNSASPVASTSRNPRNSPTVRAAIGAKASRSSVDVRPWDWTA
jgi:hypothetical protein